MEPAQHVSTVIIQMALSPALNAPTTAKHAALLLPAAYVSLASNPIMATALPAPLDNILMVVVSVLNASTTASSANLLQNVLPAVPIIA